jgi:UDP-N-acetylglucosamine--N-acetylmuramyl-(pentapeptide) pyrophosphoryl-undecaprenol N-acetylglucosamine transferase
MTVTGTPVRKVTGSYDDFEYQETFRKESKTILICGGSQGAASMNECLISPVHSMLQKKWQVVWQTGDVSYAYIKEHMGEVAGLYVFNTVDDLYPYYSAADLVICRSGASTLSEVAYFGLPCIMIPLPWAAENHQWINAGCVETQGWGIRVPQDKACSAEVEKAVLNLVSDEILYETMCRKALDHSPDGAAEKIVKRVLQHLG